MGYARTGGVGEEANVNLIIEAELKTDVGGDHYLIALRGRRTVEKTMEGNGRGGNRFASV